MLYIYVAVAISLVITHAIILDGGTHGWDEGQWYVQVDGVMGGRSSGYMQFSNGTLIFTGNINLNGGGFSSVRRNFATVDLSAYAGILVEIESATYSSNNAPLGLHFQLHDSTSSFGYAAAFAMPVAETSGVLANVFLPLASFDRGSRSGWTCNSCQLDTSRVNAMDVYVLFQEGLFEVRLRSILAVREAHLTTVPVVTMNSDEDLSDFLRAAVASGGSLYDKDYPELCIAIYNSSLNIAMVANGPSNSVKGVACAGLIGAKGGTKSERAWLLRDAIDAILADLAGTDRGSRQSWLPQQDSAAASLNACSVPPPSSSLDLTEETGSSPTAGESSSAGLFVGAGTTTGFDGPYTGMGISGYNDLGFSNVADPKDCAEKCAYDSRCKSFDYGARGGVLGECWLSTATRESAAAAYTDWPLYDYYELKKDDGVLGNSGMPENKDTTCHTSCNSNKKKSKRSSTSRKRSKSRKDGTRTSSTKHIKSPRRHSKRPKPTLRPRPRRMTRPRPRPRPRYRRGSGPRPRPRPRHKRTPRTEAK